MHDTPPTGDRERYGKARPFGSSGLAAVLGIGVFLLAMIIAGVLVLGGNDDGEDFGVANATSTPTATGQSLLAATPTVGTAVSPTTPDTNPSPTSAPGQPTPRIFPTLTPAPTTPPEPDDDGDVAEPTEPGEGLADPEPTSDTGGSGTEDPVAVEPTAPVEEPPTPVEEPVAGEFGFLPAPQLPSGGSGQSLSLTYQLATSLELVPLSATVYEIAWPSYSQSEVEQMAANIGLDGEVSSQGDGVYQVSGADGSLFVAPTIIEYGVYSAGGGGPLPTSDVAIDAAWAWFGSLGIGGVAAGNASVVAVEESAGLSVVALTPGNPAPNLAPTPSARIKVSAGGVVEEATIVWPGALYGSEYGLRSALDIWEDLRDGHAFVSADLSESGGGSATMNVTDISIAYTVAGSPWATQFIVPLVVFGGTAQVNGVSVYVSAYVPAVYHQENPSG